MDTSSRAFVAPMEWGEPEKRLTANFKSPLGDSELTLNGVHNVDLATATARQSPSLTTKSMFKLYCCLAVPLLISSTNGYAGSVMGGINSYLQYRQYFGFDLDIGTPATGIVYAVYPIGTIVGAFFVGPAVDTRGRKWGMCIGCFLILVFTCFQATATTLAQFMISRFAMGFGVAICLGAGTIYTAEIAHPSFRGVMTGLYNGFYFIGSGISAVIPWVCSKLDGSNSWRIPLWIQAFFPVLVLCTAPFLPESPRWLIANSKHERAIRTMAKFHGDGDRFSPVVQLQYKEMVEEISTTSSDKQFWDYRSLFDTSETRYRSMLVIAMGFIGQWTGIGQLGWYYPNMLNGAGLNSPSSGVMFGGISQALGFIGSGLGAAVTDKTGRRRQLIGTLSILVLFFIIATPITATTITTDSAGDPTTKSAAEAKFVIAIYLIFTFVFAFGITPLQMLYPVETLRYESRGKGMGMYFVAVNAAGFYNTMVPQLAFKGIGWRYFSVYIAWNIAAILFVFFLFPETSNRTLEQLTEVFSARWPVRKSLETWRVTVKGQETVVQREGKENREVE